MDIHFSKVFALLEPSCKGKLSSNVLDQESTKQNLLHHVGTELKFMAFKIIFFVLIHMSPIIMTYLQKKFRDFLIASYVCKTFKGMPIEKKRQIWLMHKQ